ncbi:MULTISPECIES: hypothetical protein [unclassified Streptomyces]|uniref:hypothetical protein n=1 Tax=unclassified Streptomyces TaxID=2593676 RepID=UPI0036FB6774
MDKSSWKRAGVALTAAALVAGLAGCDGGDDKAAGGKAAGGLGDVTQVLTAAYEKTSAAKAAKFRMTMEVEGTGADAGTITMTGVQGWDPTLMDVTMSGGAFAAGKSAGGPDKMRMIMRDDIMYMDMGEKQAAQMDGKRWIKMDLAGLAKESGDASLQQLTQGMGGSTNQDPAQQLAILLESPGIKHVGPEKIEGVDTEHYKGSVSLDEVLKNDKSFKGMTAEQRKSFTATLEKSGVEGYDTELWVDKDGYPAKMIVDMEMPQGSVKLTAFYSDYGTQAAVEAPPAGETVDFMEMMKGLSEAGAEG